MFSKPKTTAVLVILAFVALSVNGQTTIRYADPDPSSISTQAGETINLLCRFPAPILTCNFRIPGDDNEIKLNPDWSRTDNYRYFGKGLQGGECGITVSNVQEDMHGAASCRLDLNDGQADAFANISIIIAKAPQDPRINIIGDPSYFEAGEDIEATCSLVDGRPAATISWFLDEKPLGPGSVEITDSEVDSNVFSTAISTLHLRLTPDDNNARLICSASHVGFPDGRRNASHQLIVRFRPVPLSEIKIHGLEIGNSATIGPITIQANPAPQVMWVIDEKVINQGEQNQKFIVREPVNVGNGRFNVSLQVVSLTLEDTTRSYILRATNAVGTTDYKVRIGGSQEEPSLSIVTIIAISIISLFVLVVVALIVVARVTKRWCFAGDSMHPNGPDSEAQIAPEDDKTHEHYEQHEKSADEEPEPDTQNGEIIKATNGKAKGNTSV